MTENYIFIVLLIILVILACIHFKQPNNESFTNMHRWGERPPYCSHISQNYEVNPTTRNIVGPRPGKNYINNWQYNPQNTLVSYKYYKDNRDLNYLADKGNMEPVGVEENRSTQQLAPIIDTQLGVTTYPDVVRVNEPDSLCSTRVPNSNSTISDTYFPGNPSTSTPFVGPSVNYVYGGKLMNEIDNFASKVNSENNDNLINQNKIYS